jgi:hypothetical protein
MNTRRWLAWALSTILLAALPTLGSAQSDPTVDQIYQAANAGQLPQAQGMVDQVLRTHPDSAKAHYVKAELSARQHDGATAQQELASAERLAPGLPFARPAAVQALRTQVQQLAGVPAPDVSSARRMGGPPATAAQAPASASGGMPWGTVGIGAVVVLGAFALLRRRMGGVANGTPRGPFGSGPMPGGAMGSTGYGPGQAPGMQPGYGPNGYGGGYAQPGMGSGIGRGLATGLAVGAGALAAGEIGRRLLHPDGTPVQPDATSASNAWNDPGAGADPNADMGGQDFGIDETGSWDTGGGFDSGDVGGGGDNWNN